MQAVTGLALFGLGRFATAEESGLGGSDHACKVLRVGMARPRAGLYPVTEYDQASVALAQHIGEHLCCVGSTELQPCLAKRWATYEDDTLWTFDLRPDVLFHDGRTLTAGDVAASITLLNMAVAARALDTLIVEFRLPSPDPHFPWTLSSLNHAAIIVAEEFTRITTSKPIGTGPFQLHDYKADQGAVLVPHQGYWGRDTLPPALQQLERLEFVFFPEAEDAYIAARRGHVDRFLLPPA